MKKVIVAYTPVIHRGYLNFLQSTGAKTVYVVASADVPELSHLAREIRSLTQKELELALSPFGYEVKPFSRIFEEDFKNLLIHIPEDDVTRILYKKYFQENSVVWGTSFLRWDWTKSTSAGVVKPSVPQVMRKGNPLYAVCSLRMQMLFKEAERSSDWWRQVSAVLLPKSGESIIAYNKHYPHEYSPYMDGDPRDSFNPGEFIEISTAFHGERGAISEAARRGIALEGAEMYVTTFPCNDCANWIVAAGIKTVFFAGGYSNLNGQKTLEDYGVELVYIEL